MKTNRLIRAISTLLLFLAFGLNISCSKDETSSSEYTDVYSVSASVSGKTYAEWTAAWWQWAYAIRVHDPLDPAKVTHPLRDSTGAYASSGQDAASPVYFLAGWLYEGKTVTRNVTISSSKAIFLPIINVAADTTGGWTRDSIVNALNGYDSAPFTLTASVDGKNIPNLSSYLVRSPDFSVTLPADNVYQFIGYTFPAGLVMTPMISTGFWLMLKPLAKGTHTIHFTGTITGSGMVQDITYNITSN